MLQRQQYSPMGGGPGSPSLSRSPHVARTPTPSASPAASPAPAPPPPPPPPPGPHEHGGGLHAHAHHAAPLPPGYRYFKPGLFGGAPVWPHRDDDNRRTTHISKVTPACFLSYPIRYSSLCLQLHDHFTTYIIHVLVYTGINSEKTYSSSTPFCRQDASSDEYR